MLFSEFAMRLYPIISGDNNTDVFVQNLFSEICLFEDEDNIVENTSLSAYRSYYSGDRSINSFAKKIRKYIEPALFEEYISELSDEECEQICETFKDIYIDISPMNIEQKMAELFKNIIIAASEQKRENNKKVKKNCLKNGTEEEKEDCIGFEKEKYFSGNYYMPLGATAVLGKWRDKNSKDKEFIEQITNGSYVDFVESMRMNYDIAIFDDNGIYECKYQQDIRKELLSNIHKIHLIFLLERLQCLILESSIYSSPSAELVESIFDFLAFFGNNIAICKRINRNEWKNALFEFENTILQNGNEESITLFVNHLDILIEADIDTAVCTISNQMEKDTSTLFKMIKESDNSNVAFFLAGALRKAAALPNTFFRAMSCLFDLVPYNNVFYKNMLYVMLPWYTQTTAEYEIKMGLIKFYFKKNEDVAWQFVSDLLPGICNSSSYRKEYKHIVVRWDEISGDEIKREVESYILIACEKMTVDYKQVEKILYSWNFLSDNDAKMVSDTIIKLKVHNDPQKAIYHKIYGLLENSRNQSVVKKEELIRLRKYYGYSDFDYTATGVFHTTI